MSARSKTSVLQVWAPLVLLACMLARCNANVSRDGIAIDVTVTWPMSLFSGDSDAEIGVTVSGPRFLMQHLLFGKVQILFGETDNNITTVAYELGVSQEDFSGLRKNGDYELVVSVPCGTLIRGGVYQAQYVVTLASGQQLPTKSANIAGFALGFASGHDVTIQPNDKLTAFAQDISIEFLLPRCNSEQDMLRVSLDDQVVLSAPLTSSQNGGDQDTVQGVTLPAAEVYKGGVLSAAYLVSRGEAVVVAAATSVAIKPPGFKVEADSSIFFCSLQNVDKVNLTVSAPVPYQEHDRIKVMSNDTDQLVYSIKVSQVVSGPKGTGAVSIPCMDLSPGTYCANYHATYVAFSYEEIVSTSCFHVAEAPTEWSDWSSCNVACGEGTRTRVKQCPFGDFCNSLPTETEPCVEPACVAPTVSLAQTQLAVDEGSDIAVNCIVSADAFPEPSVKWSSPQSLMLSNSPLLSVEDIVESTTFVCTATNQVGSSSASLQVTVCPTSCVVGFTRSHKTCTVSNPAVCEPCPSCEAGTYRSQICDDSKGLGTVCSPCSECGDGTYLHSECTKTTDTLCRPCLSECAGDELLVQSCTKTRNIECASCQGTNCIVSGYASFQAVVTFPPGTRIPEVTLSVGLASNAGWACSWKSAEMRDENLLCELGNNVIFSDAIEYQLTAATGLEPIASGSLPVSEPGNGINDQSGFNISFQTVFQRCQPGHYEKYPQTSNATRFCTPVSPPCKEAEYEAEAPTQTTDRVCRVVTECGGTTPIERTPPTATSDRICRGCRITYSGSCPPGSEPAPPCEFELNGIDCVPCQPNHFSEGQACIQCITCGTGLYVKSECTPTSQTLCGVCAGCPVGMAVSEPCQGSSPGKCEDITGPTINVIGPATIYLFVGDDFEDPGVTASDAVDGSVAVDTIGDVDTTKPGTYQITYEARDSQDNVATAGRKVIVEAIPSAPMTVPGAETLTIVPSTMTSFSPPDARVPGKILGRDVNGEIVTRLYGKTPLVGADDRLSLTGFMLIYTLDLSPWPIHQSTFSAFLVVGDPSSFKTATWAVAMTASVSRNELLELCIAPLSSKLGEAGMTVLLTFIETASGSSQPTRRREEELFVTAGMLAVHANGSVVDPASLETQLSSQVASIFSTAVGRMVSVAFKKHPTAPSALLSTSSPTTPIDATSTTMGQKQGTSAPVGTIAGSIVGSLVVVVVVLAVIIFVRRRNNDVKPDAKALHRHETNEVLGMTSNPSYMMDRAPASNGQQPAFGSEVYATHYYRNVIEPYATATNADHAPVNGYHYAADPMNREHNYEQPTRAGSAGDGPAYYRSLSGDHLKYHAANAQSNGTYAAPQNTSSDAPRDASLYYAAPQREHQRRRPRPPSTDYVEVTDLGVPPEEILAKQQASESAYYLSVGDDADLNQSANA